MAYTVDILGSLTGIAAFGLMSYLLAARRWSGSRSLVALVLLRGPSAGRWLSLRVRLARARRSSRWPTGRRDAQGVETEVTWSPYYQVRYKPRYKSIDVNNLGHQGMLPVELAGPGVHAAAPAQPRRRRQAVRGRDDHRRRLGQRRGGGARGREHGTSTPSRSTRSSTCWAGSIIPTGRTATPGSRSTSTTAGASSARPTRHYDLISYAVVDSLALHSSYSSIRLESFLFTEEAFRDIKARLKPGGVFAMYNFYRQGWVVGRLVQLAEKVFGTKPLVISLPYQDVIGPTNDQRDYITFLLVGNDASTVVEAIRAQFATGPLLLALPISPASTSAQRLRPHSARRRRATAGQVQQDRPGGGRADRHRADPHATTGRSSISASRSIPALNLRGIAILAVLSLIVLFAFAPVRTRPAQRPDVLPRRGIHAAGDQGRGAHGLLFGSTWMVNSIVFFAILAMILLSNLYVWPSRPSGSGLISRC